MTTNTGELEVRRRHHLTQIIRRVAWLHFKLSLGTWAVAFMLVPPTATQSAVGNILWLAICLTGAIVSSVGLILGFWARWRRLSVIIELAGLFLMIVGPFVYWTTQVSIIVEKVTPDAFQQRFALAIFAWAMIAAVLARIATVFPRFRLTNGRIQYVES